MNCWHAYKYFIVVTKTEKFADMLTRIRTYIARERHLAAYTYTYVYTYVCNCCLYLNYLLGRASCQFSPFLVDIYSINRSVKSNAHTFLTLIEEGLEHKNKIICTFRYNEGSQHSIYNFSLISRDIKKTVLKYVLFVLRGNRFQVRVNENLLATYYTYLLLSIL